MAKSPRNNTSNHAKNILSVLYLMQKRWDNDWYDEQTDFSSAFDFTVQDLIDADQDNKLIESTKPKPFIFR
jgi:hypothetical protein